MYNPYLYQEHNHHGSHIGNSIVQPHLIYPSSQYGANTINHNGSYIMGVSDGSTTSHVPPPPPPPPPPPTAPSNVSKSNVMREERPSHAFLPPSQSQLLDILGKLKKPSKKTTSRSRKPSSSKQK